MTQAYCQHCGTQRGSGAFCANCGQPFDQPAASQPYGLNNPAGFRPMVVNPLVLLLFELGGVVVAFVVFAYLAFGIGVITGLPLLAGFFVAPVVGFLLGQWAATNLLR